MQGTHYLDLARTLAEEHNANKRRNADDKPKKGTKPRHTTRERLGHALISAGERIVPNDARFTVSTGPPRL